MKVQFIINFTSDRMQYVYIKDMELPTAAPLREGMELEFEGEKLHENGEPLHMIDGMVTTMFYNPTKHSVRCHILMPAEIAEHCKAHDSPIQGTVALDSLEDFIEDLVACGFVKDMQSEMSDAEYDRKQRSCEEIADHEYEDEEDDE